MKKLFRLVVAGLLVGGWATAASTVHVLRTPTGYQIVTKDRPDFHDTYLDVRKWTLADDTAHPAVVARLVHLGRSDLLAHTLDPHLGDAAAQLSSVAVLPPTSRPTIVEQAKAGIEGIKSKL